MNVEIEDDYFLLDYFVIDSSGREKPADVLVSIHDRSDWVARIELLHQCSVEIDRGRIIVRP